LSEVCHHNFIVDTATGWTNGVQLLSGQDCSFCYSIQNRFVALPAPYLMGTMVLSSGVKQLGHDTVHLLSSSAEVKSVLSYTSAVHVCSWHGVLLGRGTTCASFTISFTCQG
jgi:hypothetical protein